MKHFLILSFSFFVALAAHADDGHGLCVVERKLSNGMTVWLNPDTTQTKAIGYVVVKAGARDCPNTGIAHYFEHIMFKGTQTIGTTDYEKEKPLLEQISQQYNALSRTADPSERLRIQQEINRLNREAAVYAIPNEFSKLLTRYGGSRINAYTSLDETVYHSEFAPQYLRQWCALNSERFINPVFRLFQGELETVYEEKNRASDDFGRSIMDHAQQLIFQGSSYGFPIIGSTENLKNPRLSDMEAFFQKYYVANNMGLIISGNFPTDSILPLLEQTFGRIRGGSTPERRPVELPAFRSDRVLGLKIPFPFIKATALLFRGPKPFSPDYGAVQLAMGLLTNNNGSGLVDSLASHHALMYSMAAADRITFTNEVGLIGLMAVPRLPFGTKRKAEKLLWEQIDKLKTGRFSDAALAAAKLEYLNNQTRTLENIDSRIAVMADAFSGGSSWNDYLAAAEKLRHLTREDVMAVCRKYFSDENYLRLHKKFGFYKKDKIAKPPYAPVRTADENSRSAYARRLAGLPTASLSPRTIDFSTAVERRSLGDNAMLYAAGNPLNDLFELTLTWRQDHVGKPIHLMNDLFDYLGTALETKLEFAKRLQSLGVTLQGNYTYKDMTLTLSGPDRHLTASLDLVGRLLESPKTDDKFMRMAKTDDKLGQKYFGRDMNDILWAMVQRMAIGHRSPLLQGMDSKEIARLTATDAEQTLKTAQQGALSVTYTGRLSADSVAQALRRTLPKAARTAYEGYVYDVERIDRPTVYVYDKPDARQAMVGTCSVLPPLSTDEAGARFAVWRSYFSNGGLNSVLFRELRDLRSLCYSTTGLYIRHNRKAWKTKPIAYFTMAGTQTDKALTTLTLIDSLLNAMPCDETGALTARQSCLNAINNAAPAFRELPGYVAESEWAGYAADPNIALAEAIGRVSPQEVFNYYKESVQSAPRAYFVIGNLKAIDRAALARLGHIVEWTKKDLTK